MIFWRLFVSFVQIGLVAFGGGYAMIPLIQAEVLRQGYLTAQEFIDILAVSEMTPGPMAINMATYAGFRIGGPLGAFLATLGVVLPSLVLILVLAPLMWKLRELPRVRGLFRGLRAVITALITSAALFVGLTAWEEAWEMNPWHLAGGLALMVAVFLALRFKVNPVVLIFLSALLGMLLFR